MSDQPLTRAELAEVHRMHAGKPQTKVLPTAFWRNPAAGARFLRETIERERKKMWKD